MGLSTSYLTSTKTFEGIMNSILGARAPDRFTNKFLEDLGYKSSNDRLITGVLKSLGMLNDAGEPTQRYFDFLDQSQSKKVIAVGVQEAYEDLFNLNKEAQKLSQDEVKNKLRTLTQGQKGDKVIESMARTFRVLCDYADWSDIELKDVSAPEQIPVQQENADANTKDLKREKLFSERVGLHYNIQIHLPETTNMAVYDAIFQSLKRHLL